MFVSEKNLSKQGSLTSRSHRLMSAGNMCSIALFSLKNLIRRRFAMPLSCHNAGERTDQVSVSNRHAAVAAITRYKWACDTPPKLVGWVLFPVGPHQRIEQRCLRLVQPSALMFVQGCSSSAVLPLTRHQWSINYEAPVQAEMGAADHSRHFRKEYTKRV